VVVGENEAGLVDDEARSGAFLRRDLAVRCLPASSLLALALTLTLSEEALQQVVLAAEDDTDDEGTVVVAALLDCSGDLDSELLAAAGVPAGGRDLRVQLVVIDDESVGVEHL
jgi:hypothetical protein